MVWQNRLRLISDFLSSRRQGLSPETIHFYKSCLTRAFSVIGLLITSREISNYLNILDCSGGGKHAYYRALRAFYKWLYSPKSGYNLNPQNNPILHVASPLRENRIMPGLNQEQMEYLMSRVDLLVDKCIIRLLFDFGMRLRELTKKSTFHTKHGRIIERLPQRQSCEW